MDKTTTGDGIIAALLVLAEMQTTGKSLHELKSGMSKYPQVLLNVKTPGKIDLDNNPAIKAAVESAECQLGDKGRVLLRASGTEPLIRVMVEGRGQEKIQRLAAELSESVRQAIGA